MSKRSKLVPVSVSQKRGRLRMNTCWHWKTSQGHDNSFHLAKLFVGPPTIGLRLSGTLFSLFRSRVSVAIPSPRTYHALNLRAALSFLIWRSGTLIAGALQSLNRFTA